MKPRKTNAELLKRYEQKFARAVKRLDRAGLKMIRATAYYTRSRDEHKYLERRIAELEQAIGQGKLYPDVKEKKKKQGRHIELE